MCYEVRPGGWSAQAFEPLPASACWRHQGLRDGFEVAFFESSATGHVIQGHTSAVEDGRGWTVGYQLRLGTDWTTRSAYVCSWSETGFRELRLESAGPGSWLVNGLSPSPTIEGCVDIDLESSVVTNTLPVHRLTLEPGQEVASPAAYVRALSLQTSKLDQVYARLPSTAAQLFHYKAPSFDFACELAYDRSGLIVDYPGIAVRVQ